MTAPFLSPGFRATDADDNPLAGGSIRFYAAGTTTPKAVYSDASLSTSLGSTVNLNSAGAPVSGSNTAVLIYPGIGDYKIRYYDSDSVLVFEFDNYPGAVVASASSSTATPVFPVISKTTSYVVTVDDRGKLINANPTGGSFSITLPSAVTVGDNFLIGIRHNGTANAVSLIATGSQNIRFQGNRTAFSLNGQGEALWLISDGSDWIGCGYVPPFRKDLAPYFIVLDRLTSPPANPDAGARYLINGTPTGAWSTLAFAEKDIAEADGNGSWIKHTPEEGWMAFDADEKISLVYKNGAWANFQVDPGKSTLKTFIVQDQKSSNTDGGTATQDAWTTAVLNTSVVNTITNASLASNKITLPAGRYRVRARKVFAVTGETRIRLKKDSAGTVVGLSESVHSGNIVSTNSANAIVAVTAALECEFEISESTDFVLEYYVNVNQHTTATQGLGIPSNISGAVETYATVIIEDLAAQQGPTGPQGATGPDGLDAAYAYQFATATSGDPGTGKIRTNHATPASVTQIAVHQTDANGGVLTAVIATWDDSTSDNKARVRFHKEGAPQNFFEFLITGTGTDVGDYWTFPVSYVSHGGTISNGNDVALLVVQTGDHGDPGTTVPDISGLSSLSGPITTGDSLIVNRSGTHYKAPLSTGAYASTANYGAGHTGNFLEMVLGSSGTPSTSPDAVLIVQKHSSADVTSGTNAAGYFSIFKRTAGSANARFNGLYAEAQDQIGGTGSYIEGVRGQSTVNGANGSGYGVIGSAGNMSATAFDYLVSIEGDCNVYGLSNQPTHTSFNSAHIAAAFIATTFGNTRPDVCYLCNPFNTVPFQTGLLIAANSVADTGIAMHAALVNGIDLSVGSYSAAAIKLPNDARVVVPTTARLVSTDAGAALGPVWALTRHSASPADNDIGGGLAFDFYNDAGTPAVWRAGLINSVAIDVSAGIESAVMQFQVNKGAGLAVEMSLWGGAVIGNPTGFTQGVGSLNIADAYYVNANRVVNGRKTGWGTATGTATRTTFATGSVTLSELAERVKALIDDLHQTAGHGLIGT